MPQIMTRNPAVRNFFAKKQAKPAFTSAEVHKAQSFAHAGDFAQSPIKQKSKGHNCPMLSVILFFALL